MHRKQKSASYQEEASRKADCSGSQGIKPRYDEDQLSGQTALLFKTKIRPNCSKQRGLRLAPSKGVSLLDELASTSLNSEKSFQRLAMGTGFLRLSCLKS